MQSVRRNALTCPNTLRRNNFRAHSGRPDPARPASADHLRCDAAAAFPATNAPVQHQWINYTGCDSYYAVAADANDVYVAGHERWADNPSACDSAGPGSVSRPGLGALSPSTGQATSWNPTRARGAGADDALITAAGLWVASDNFHDGAAQQCGGKTNHGGICFLPYQ